MGITVKLSYVKRVNEELFIEDCKICKNKIIFIDSNKKTNTIRNIKKLDSVTTGAEIHCPHCQYKLVHKDPVLLIQTWNYLHGEEYPLPDYED